MPRKSNHACYTDIDILECPGPHGLLPSLWEEPTSAQLDPKGLIIVWPPELTFSSRPLRSSVKSASSIESFASARAISLPACACCGLPAGTSGTDKQKHFSSTHTHTHTHRLPAQLQSCHSNQTQACIKTMYVLMLMDSCMPHACPRYKQERRCTYQGHTHRTRWSRHKAGP